MKISEMIPSAYLKQSDFDENGIIVTVSHLEEKNVARADDAPEHKWVVFFKEYPEKGMVMNSTNINLMAKACESEDTDDWTGKEVVVYVDPNVGFGGKTTGGLRIKKYTQPAPPRTARSAY